MKFLNILHAVLEFFILSHTIFVLGGEFDEELRNATTTPTSTTLTTSANATNETVPTTAVPTRKNLTSTPFSPYIFEPPCPCSSNVSCGPECCYCDLGCPLPLGIDGQPWLNTLYGDKCQNRNKYHGLPVAKEPSRAFKQNMLEAKASWSCARSDINANILKPSFDFLCFVADNSHTLSYFKWRKHRFHPADLLVVSKTPFSWPVVMPYGSPCLPVIRNVTKTNVTVATNGSSTTTTTTTSTTAPPTTSTVASTSTASPRVKRQLSRDCVQPIGDVGIALLSSSSRRSSSKTLKKGPWDQLWSLPHSKILGSALLDLKKKKSHISVTFQPRPKDEIASCKDARQFLHSFSQLWTQFLVNVTHTNSTKAGAQIPIKQLNLLQTTVATATVPSAEAQVGLNESFPSNCQNIPTGLVINAFHYRDQLVEIHHKNMISQNSSVKMTPDFYVHLVSLDTIEPLKRKLSRFWLQYQLYKCPESYCWRDILDLSFLPVNRAILFVAVFLWLSISMLLYQDCSFDPCLVFF